MLRVSRWRFAVSLAVGLGASGIGSLTDAAQDSISFSKDAQDEQSGHEGYYYPKPKTLEHFVSSAITLPESESSA